MSMSSFSLTEGWQPMTCKDFPPIFWDSTQNCPRWPWLLEDQLPVGAKDAYSSAKKGGSSRPSSVSAVMKRMVMNFWRRWSHVISPKTFTCLFPWKRSREARSVRVMMRSKVLWATGWDISLNMFLLRECGSLCTDGINVWQCWGTTLKKNK